MNRTTALPSLSPGGKVAQGAQVLADLAQKLGPGAKLPTVRDLRKQLQVSQATLDAALGDLELRGLIDRKPGSGLYVSRAVGMRRIGLLMSRQALVGQGPGHFSTLLMEALQSECRTRGDLLNYYVYDGDQDFADHDTQRLRFDIENKRVDAVIISGLNQDQADQVQAMGIPNVSFSGFSSRVPRVDSDAFSLISQGVQALAQRGGRRIALAYPGYAGTPQIAPFLEVFQQSIFEEGAVTKPNWLIRFDGEEVALRPLEASRQFHRLWADADRPDALLSFNDQYTAGVLHAAELLGVRIPRDLLVASQANVGANLFGETDVIRIEYNPLVIVQACLRTLDELMGGKPATPVRVVPPRVRMRNSICDPMRAGNRLL